MHTQTLHGHCATGPRRGFFAAFGRRRNWWRRRRQAHIAKRLGLSASQRERLHTLQRAVDQSRERVRTNVTDLFPQLDELLLQSDFSSESLAAVLRGALKTLDGEVEHIATHTGEFLDSLDSQQRNIIREGLRRRLR